MDVFVGAVIVIVAALLFSAIKVLREYERGVVFMLGRFYRVKGPGLIVLIPIVQQMVRVDLRTKVLDVPSQDLITRDNVSVKVNAVIYFRVVDPQQAIINVENYMEATGQMAQTTLRSVLGQHELDELLAERDRLNSDIQKILDAATDIWGIKVANVEIKHVDIDESMIRAIARQAEAERERRAKVIHADGEYQAATKLVEAAALLAREPAINAAALSADLDGGRGRQEHDDRLPCTDERPRRVARSHARRTAEAVLRAPHQRGVADSGGVHSTRRPVTGWA